MIKLSISPFHLYSCLPLSLLPAGLSIFEKYVLGFADLPFFPRVPTIFSGDLSILSL